MEDCCVVCAEPLEWVAYGPCGHKDVCSTCITRLRFILNDKKCCICKQECQSIFITRALGDYTNKISNFEALSFQNDANKGGKQYWHDSSIEAYFSDEDHFKMIKAMCRLYCRICEQVEYSDRREFFRKGYIFGNLGLLRKHIFRAHGLHMCELCLEGRKIFICEQKLYTRGQLECHLARGDSEVDGDEGERAGFIGHPMCVFCQKRFYGDSELFQHMTRDHFTCHICQRVHPELFDYYQNYNDLEAHFRHEHHLCEDQECLDKKFVVFPLEAELKRHYALLHGGNMSRAQRTAALRIPVSFQYRRAHQDRRNTGISQHIYNGDLSDNGHAETMCSTIETVISESTIHETAPARERFESYNFASDFPNHESRAIIRSSNSPQDLSIMNKSGPSTLEKSAFPALSGSSRNARKSKQHRESSAVSMAARLRTRDSGPRVKNYHDSGMNRAQVSATSYASEVMSVQQNNSLMRREANNRQPRSWYEPQPGSGSGILSEASAGTSSVRSTKEEGNDTHFSKLSMDELHVSDKDDCKDVLDALKGKTKMSMSNGTCSSSNAADGKYNPTQVLDGVSDLYLPTHSTSSITDLHDTWSCACCTLENHVNRMQCAACGMTRPAKNASNVQDSKGDEKKKKKMSKFKGARLGGGSAPSAVSGARENPWGLDNREGASHLLPTDGKSFGRGVWGNGGGQKLVLKAQKDALVDSVWTRKK